MPLELKVCSECGRRVVPTDDGTCPACRKRSFPPEPQATPAEPEEAEPCAEPSDEEPAPREVEEPAAPVPGRPAWIIVAGALALATALLTLFFLLFPPPGVATTALSDEGLVETTVWPGDAVRMPAAAALIAATLGLCGAGLLARRWWGWYGFLVVAPWASIALASAWAPLLWREDVPSTAVGIAAYVPLAFLLSRGRAARALGASDGGWIDRGGPLLGLCVAAMGVAWFLVRARGYDMPPGSGGFAYHYQVADSLNAYVRRLVLCKVPLWHYVGALVAVSVPPVRLRRGRATSPGA